MVNARKLKELSQRYCPLLLRFYNRVVGSRYVGRSPAETFGYIYRNTWFGGKESVSGPGSTREETAAIRLHLTGWLRKYEIHSLLDAPCGDVHWIPELLAELQQLEYTGVDIVPELIVANQKKCEGGRMRFLVADVIQDRLPSADCLLCRDCLVHLSNAHARAALENFRRSGIRFLLATTFPATRINTEILTGLWRPTNLELPPFSLPAPLELVQEETRASNFSDKAMALFDLRAWKDGEGAAGR